MIFREQHDFLSGGDDDNGWWRDNLHRYGASGLVFRKPRALIRYQDGSASGLMVASRVGDYQLSVPHLSDFDDPLKIDQTSPAIEPVRLVFCGSTRHVYDAIVEEIAPQSDGTCQVTAKEYRASFYDYDNASYPGDIA